MEEPKEVILLSKTALFAFCILAPIIALVGCRPSAETASANVQASMQQTFDTEPQFRPLGLRVSKVALIRDDDNAYQGLATVVSAGGTHDISITVIADGENTIWKSEPGALLGLSLQDSLSHASRGADISRPALKDRGATQSDIGALEQRAIELVKLRYTFKTDVSDEGRNGKWYSSHMGPDDGSYVDVAVDYVIPSQAAGCRFIVGFPVTTNRYYNISMDERAKKLFTEAPNKPAAREH